MRATLLTRLSGLLGLCLALAAPAPQAQTEASGGAVTNAAADALGGQVESQDAHVLGVNFDWLFGEFLGVQMDVAGGEALGDDVRSLGGHFFWNNPDKGVVDFNATHAKWGDIDLARIGVIGKWYSPITTLTGRLEYQNVDLLADGLIVSLDASWYATDRFMVKAGGQNANGENQLNLGFEFLPGWVPVPGLSLVGQAARGENGYDHFFVGVRYYFGPGHTLQQHHRLDVPLGPPSDWLTGDIQTLEKARSKVCRCSPNSDTFCLCFPQ